MTFPLELFLELLANDLLYLDKLCEDKQLDPDVLSKLEEESVDKPRPLADSEPDSAGHGERFQVVSEGDCESFIKENENKNTHNKTRSDDKLLFDWMKSIAEHTDLEETPPKEQLGVLLAR
jgi:hypothetical protein